MTLLRIVLLAAVFLAAAARVQAGSIQGDVRFIGPLGKPNRIKATKDQDYCGEFVPDETYLVSSTGGLKNAVVFLAEAPLKAIASGKEHVLENSGCRFVPRIVAMMKGERLITKNSDPKLHIVHSYLERRTVFNVSLPFRGQMLEVTRRIERAGILQVNCDTHAWMRAYVHVFAHPYFAVSGEQGNFIIPDVPAGKYTLKAWHEGAGVQSREVLVPETGDSRVVFEFQ